MGTAPASAPDRKVVLLYVLAAVSALAIVLGPLFDLRCDVCSGGLASLALPWIGMAFYSVLAVLAARRPRAPFLLLLPGFYLFVHASLVTEMLLVPMLCGGCLAAATFAAAAALRQGWGNRQDLMSAGLAVVLGTGAAFLSPFDRVDDFVTRKLWPARKLESAPAWVPREDLARCDHATGARLVLYEKDCKS